MWYELQILVFSQMVVIPPWPESFFVLKLQMNAFRRIPVKRE
jgi:hypothetical protein